ncbi:MAG: hypothetical protein CL912_13255 [Deltaproteobacteria bacterium]|nr:hypothetical protein [Deltaproteobacteria bacterium]
MPNLYNNVTQGNLLPSVIVLILLQARQVFVFADKSTPWTPPALQTPQITRTLALYSNEVVLAMVFMPVVVEIPLWRLGTRFPAPARKMKAEYVSFCVSFFQNICEQELTHVHSDHRRPLSVSLVATQQLVILQAVVQNHSEAQ